MPGMSLHILYDRNRTRARYGIEDKVSIVRMERESLFMDHFLYLVTACCLLWTCNFSVTFRKCALTV